MVLSSHYKGEFKACRVYTLKSSGALTLVGVLENNSITLYKEGDNKSMLLRLVSEGVQDEATTFALCLFTRLYNPSTAPPLTQKWAMQGLQLYRTIVA